MPVDMTPEAIDARLREVARSSTFVVPSPPRVDMNPEALAARLDEVTRLNELCEALARARPENA